MMMSIGTVADTYCRNGQGCQYAAGIIRITRRDNDTSVIRGPAIRKAGWLNSNGAVKHTAACEKSHISGVIRKSTEKLYFQKALPSAVSA